MTLQKYTSAWLQVHWVYECLELDGVINPDRVHEHVALQIEQLDLSTLSEKQQTRLDDFQGTLLAQHVEYEAIILAPKLVKPRLIKVCGQAIDDRLAVLQRKTTEAQKKTPLQELHKALLETFPALWTELYETGTSVHVAGRNAADRRIGKMSRALARDTIRLLDV